MANESNSRWINVLAGFQVGNCGFGIAGQFHRGGLLPGTCRLANSALVVAQYRNSLASQKVRNNEKRPMIREEFIAILGPRTGDQQGGGKRTRPFGKAKGTRESYTRGLVGKGDFFFAVGVRLGGILWTA